jgi:hypothetical protein
MVYVGVVAAFQTSSSLPEILAAPSAGAAQMAQATAARRMEIWARMGISGPMHAGGRDDRPHVLSLYKFINTWTDEGDRPPRRAISLR